MDQSPDSNAEGQKTFRRFFGILTVLIVLISQIVLYNTPIVDTVTAPFSFWSGILGLILFIISQVVTPPRRILNLFARIKAPPASARLAGAGILALLTTYAMVSFQKYDRMNYLPVLSLWCFSGFFYLSAFALPELSKNKIIRWVRANQISLIVLFLITLMAAAIRFYRLGDIPRVINGDEGLFGLIAQTTTSGKLANPFALYSNVGALYLQILNISISLFQANAFSLRFLSAIAGILAIPATYVFSRKVFGNRVALIAVAIMAVSHTHINFSRTGTGYIQDTWLIPLELFLLLNGLEKRRSWQTALSGMLVALHFSYYLTAQAMVALILAYQVICLIFYRSWFKTVFKQVAAFWGGLLILLLPTIYYVLQSPLEFIDRISSDGSIQSGWLEMMLANSGRGVIQILSGRVIHTFLALIYYPAFDFYGSPAPMLSVITGTLFLIGLGINLIKTRNRPSLLLNTIFFGFTLLIGVFTIPPSADSYRMVVVLPFAFLLAAVGLDQILTLLGLDWTTSMFKYVSVASIVFIMLMFTNLQTYFGEFAGRCQYGGNSESRFASYLGSYVANIDKEARVYLLSDDIYFYGSHPSVDFLSHSHPIINVIEPVDTQTFQEGDILIASPKRISELESWIRSQPGDNLQYRYDCTKTILLGYQVP